MSIKKTPDLVSHCKPSGLAEIVFDSWDIGFHGFNPGLIHIGSQAQGMEILQVLACATSSHDGIYARMFTKSGKISYWRIWDEELYELEPEDYPYELGDMT